MEVDYSLFYYITKFCLSVIISVRVSFFACIIIKAREEENIKKFCKIVRQRSQDNKNAVKLLLSQNLFANITAILRQELDSLTRVLFILSKKNNDYRNNLIADCLQGERWRVTDKKLVENAMKLHGWAHLVYKFGCSFIHLSNLCDFNSINLSVLPILERRDIACYINQYHNSSLSEEFSINDVSPLLPDVFTKNSDNLEYHIFIKNLIEQ